MPFYAGTPLSSPPAAGGLGRITRVDQPVSVRGDFVRLLSGEERGEELRGFAALLAETARHGEVSALAVEEDLPPILLLRTLGDLGEGDVVAVEPGGVRRLYRRLSKHNAIFATDRCNSLCLMCSQPPRAAEDRERIREHLRLIELIDPETEELGLTGGEPTLLHGDLVHLVAHAKEHLPRTALHILSNGRLFYYGSLARDLAAVGHPDLMIGVPLYSDIDTEHDHIVQARGAFDQTLVGLQNLGRWGIATEIRVVVHRLNVQALRGLAEFIYRNLSFASHVTFLGLEPIGFAVANAAQLWVDPFDYQEELAKSVLWLAARGLQVSIYNHQLCLLPRAVWGYSRRSISDWKNEYLGACEECSVKAECGGFFSSAIRRRHSQHIQTLPPTG